MGSKKMTITVKDNQFFTYRTFLVLWFLKNDEFTYLSIMYLFKGLSDLQLLHLLAKVEKYTHCVLKLGIETR